MDNAGTVPPIRSRGYRPGRIQTSPLFRWPTDCNAILKWLLGFPGYLWPWATLIFATSALCWFAFEPDIATIREFSATWIALTLARNMAIVTVFVGGWHLWLYVWKVQGTQYKYTERWPSSGDPIFLFRDQVWDNMFRTLCSGVPICTACEILTLWLQANGTIPTVSWRQHPVYCALLVLIIPLWIEAHFYAIHRLIHWGPLYRAVHYIHHKNINTGPWSGLAMHPVEHILLFSAVLLFWIVPAHPLHVLYLLLTNLMAPTLAHSGFHRVVLRGGRSLDVDSYMHYLHHRYVTVNYGGAEVPLDRWLGTFHDGSDEANDSLKKKRARGARVPPRRPT